MTVAALAVTVVPQGARHARPALASGTPVGRLLLAVVAVGAAASYSLASLLDSWESDSPVGELALVPLLAVVLGALAVRRHPFLATVRPGRLDLLVGGLGVAAVGVTLVVGPVVGGNYFWATRLDLLTLPLLAASFVAVLVGTRAVLAFLFPLGFLLLAWPLPLLTVLDRAQQPLTALSSAAVRAGLHALPVAHPVDDSGDLVLRVSGSHPFEVSVSSACSGIQGIVGVLLVGTAAMYVVRGPARARLAWLGVGVLAAFVVNLLRILLIVAVGAAWGQAASMEILHPVAGLLVLDVLALGMLLLLPSFGLRLRSFGPALGDVPLTAPTTHAPPLPRGRFHRRAAAVLAVAALLGVADLGLRDAAGAFDNSGLPAAEPFSPDRVLSPAVSVRKVGHYAWARTYFGEDSTWRRFVLRPVDAYSHYTVWLDSIVTNDVGALHARPVASCYHLHGFSTPVHQIVQLSHGVVAQQFVYVRRDGAQWHSLTWEWPVEGRDGSVLHERVVLFASSLRSVPAPAPRAGNGFSVRGALLDAVNRTRPDSDPNAAVTAALTADAELLVSRHLGHAAPEPSVSPKPPAIPQPAATSEPS